MRAWTWRGAPWVALAAAGAAIAAVAGFVDLSPRVEGEFFFADDDPQMRATREVAERFPPGAQLILRVADPVGDTEAYRARVATLTAELLSVEGVTGGYSVTTTDAVRSPLFRRLLLTPDPAATNVVLQVDGTDPALLLPRVEAVVDRHRDGLDIVVSGVPAIVELIRRSLQRDLATFSGAAVLVFALLLAFVYRDAAIVVGTLATCFVSVGATLTTVQAAGVGIGLLTANLVTIVFVLTLSHVVFLTANWRHGAGDRDARLASALRATWEGSFWSMATTLLGFASLLVATARPLRELGTAGVVGSLAALAVSYTVYPAFLGRWARVVDGLAFEGHGPAATDRGLPGTRSVVIAAFVAVAVLASAVPRLDTDPSLLSYFAPGSELRDGLELIDADGGSSTLELVVRDPDGGPVSSPTAYPELQALQRALESDEAVGVVLSPVLLVEHARTIPFAGLLPVPRLLDMASSEALGGVGRGFLTPDQTQARFSLRVRESAGEPRDEVTRRVLALTRDVGLDPVVVAGLYPLQAELGRLIRSSLALGVGGLLLLFLGVAAIVARRVAITAAMWACLASIPLVILGAFAWSGTAVDIITSPSANIALAIGADSMIHLVVRVRRLGRGSRAPAWSAATWRDGVRQIGRPVLGATAIICAGFGIFALSSFPPTQRFGFAVIVGTLTAATMALLVLPRLACFRRAPADSLSAS